MGSGVQNFALGDAVIVFAPNSFSNFVTVNAKYIAPKPKYLSFEQAAAIPINFLTAYYTLHHLASIASGQRVLIHAAAGGTGMAAVQIARNVGAEIFATASPSKWDVLRGMGVRHIMNSRTTEFADRIMELTEGKGVDVILNSLISGDFIYKSLSVLAPKGCFLENSRARYTFTKRISRITSGQLVLRCGSARQNAVRTQFYSVPSPADWRAI